MATLRSSDHPALLVSSAVCAPVAAGLLWAGATAADATAAVVAAVFLVAWLLIALPVSHPMNPPDSPKSYGVRAYVDAWQVTATNIADVAQWCGGEPAAATEQAIDFPDARGATSTAELEDWVVRGTTGDFFALSSHWFHEHYYREDRPVSVTRGVLTGDQLRINDRRETR